MKRRRYNNYNRKASKKFGRMLKKWREDVHMTQSVAAKKLGIRSKNPAAYLSQIENGHKAIPHEVLLNVAEIYNQTPEIVLKLAYWPQLRFSLLDSIIKPSVAGKEIEKYLTEIEEELNQKEKRELARYASYLLLKRQM